MLFDKPFVTLRPNAAGRDFCIGDLHGCLDMLECLLAYVAFDERRDRLFSVGDLVHRGPWSVECLKLAEKTWFYAVMGNHEAMQRAAYDGAINRDGRLVVSLCEYSGQDDALRPGRPDQPRMEEILDRLPLAFEFSLKDGRRIGIVHAGMPNDWTWSDVQSMVTRDLWLSEKRSPGVQSQLLWDRLPMIAAANASSGSSEIELQTLYPAALRYEYELAIKPVPGLDLLVSGHTTLAVHHPLSTGSRLYLDTGAGMPDGYLSMIELLTGRYWRVPDPRRTPGMPVTEHGEVPMVRQSLAWVTPSERAAMEAARAAAQ